MFRKKLNKLISKYSKEEDAHTEQYILAKYIEGSLKAYEDLMRRSDTKTKRFLEVSENMLKKNKEYQKASKKWDCSKKEEEEKPTELFPERKDISDVTNLDVEKVNYVGTEGNDIIFDYEGELHHVDVSILSSSFQSLSWCRDVIDVWEKRIDPKHEPLGMVDLENNPLKKYIEEEDFEEQMREWVIEERRKKFERERHIDNALKPKDEKVDNK